MNEMKREGSRTEGLVTIEAIESCYLWNVCSGNLSGRRGEILGEDEIFGLFAGVT